MGAHLVNGAFQSDKYPTTPPGKVPLSVEDVTAQDLLWQYAQRRRGVDAEFSDDLEAALRSAGYAPPAAEFQPHLAVDSRLAEIGPYQRVDSDAPAQGPNQLVDLGPPPDIAPGVDLVAGTFTCPKCGVQRDCQAFNPECMACHYFDPGLQYLSAEQLRALVGMRTAEADHVYTERNRLVAALARFALSEPGAFWFAGVGKHQPEGDPNWEKEWTNVVFIDTPQGQLSWHVHDRDLPLFEGLPKYLTAWDGHTTAEKYERLARVIAKMSLVRPVDEISALAKRMVQDGGAPDVVAMAFLCEALVRMRMLETRSIVNAKVVIMLDGIDQATREHAERWQSGKKGP